MKKKTKPPRQMPKPAIPAPIENESVTQDPNDQDEFSISELVGEKEVRLLWGVYDSVNRHYKPQAWFLRFPEYLGMLRVFVSTAAPWSLLEKTFAQTNEYSLEKLGQRSGDYLRSISEALMDFDNQGLDIRRVHVFDRSGIQSSKIPEPTTLYQFFRALQILCIPRASEMVFQTIRPILKLPTHVNKSEDRIIVTRRRVPVETMNMMPTWEQAKAFSDLRKRKSREAGELNCTTRQPAGRPRIDSLSEAVMSHSWRKSEKEGFKDLIARFCKDISPTTDDRDTLIELFSYQQLELAIKSVEDFTAFIAANESLPPEEKASSAEIWNKWNAIWRVESSMMLRKIGRQVTNVARELAPLKHSNR